MTAQWTRRCSKGESKGKTEGADCRKSGENPPLGGLAVALNCA